MKSPRAILIFLGFCTLLSAARAADHAIVSRIKREPVISTNVASIGYSRHLRVLEIEFTRGAIYRFLEVPRSVYGGLMASDSKGHFIAENIRGKYGFVRVRPRKGAAAGRAIVRSD